MCIEKSARPTLRWHSILALPMPGSIVNGRIRQSYSDAMGRKINHLRIRPTSYTVCRLSGPSFGKRIPRKPKRSILLQAVRHLQEKQSHGEETEAVTLFAAHWTGPKISHKAPAAGLMKSGPCRILLKEGNQGVHALTKRAVRPRDIEPLPARSTVQ